jgi:hypothetical protein
MGRRVGGGCTRRHPRRLTLAAWLRRNNPATLCCEESRAKRPQPIQWMHLRAPDDRAPGCVQPQSLDEKSRFTAVSHGASRTRTGDLLGAMQTRAGLSGESGHRYAVFARPGERRRPEVPGVTRHTLTTSRGLFRVDQPNDENTVRPAEDDALAAAIGETHERPSPLSERATGVSSRRCCSESIPRKSEARARRYPLGPRPRLYEIGWLALLHEHQTGQWRI